MICYPAALSHTGFLGLQRTANHKTAAFSRVGCILDVLVLFWDACTPSVVRLTGPVWP